MRTGLAAAILIIVLVGLPLVVLPSWFIGFCGLVAAAFCVGGFGAHMASLVTAGATLATIEYTFAVCLVGGVPRFASAIAFGVTLYLLVELADFTRKVRGTTIGTAVLTSMIRYWLVVGSTAVIVITGLVAAAAVVQWVAFASHSVATMVGGFGAFVVAIGMFKILARSDESPTSRDADLQRDYATPVRRGA